MDNTLYGGKEAARRLRGALTIYMLGIGGVGMSSLAAILKQRGYIVTGEDRAASTTVQALKDGGIRVTDTFHGLGESCDAVVYSAAIPPSHPAFKEAKARGISILSRSDVLAALMLEKPKRVTVAGIHGKSTVTAMIDRILVHAGCLPTTVSGASLTGGMTYRIGRGDVFLAEACEYTDSFLSFSPTLAVAINLEHDHPDYFRDEEAVRASFRRYLENAEEGAVLPTCGPLCSLAPKGLPIFTFGQGGDLSCEIERQEEARTDFSLIYRGKACGTVRLPLIGTYQVENALAAILTAKQLGVSFESSSEALSEFVSPDRRCKHRLTLGGVRYFDDYAHHPSEIKAVLSTLKTTSRGRLFCAFEAHTYSRLAAFFDDYCKALSIADSVAVLPIFPARETDTLGQSEGRLSEALSVPSRAFTDLEDAAHYLMESTAAGDTVAVLGAGNTPRLFELLFN